MAMVLCPSAPPFTYFSAVHRLEQLHYLFPNNPLLVCCSRYRPIFVNIGSRSVLHIFILAIFMLTLGMPDSVLQRYWQVAASGNDPVREWILGEGGATKINRISPVGGGCISIANHYDTDAGSFFVKTNRDIGPPMFEAEAIGLNAMYATNSIRVPKPFKVGPLPGRGSYIIMEFIEFGSSGSNQAKLGRKLGQMHKSGTSDKGFGFMVNNTIGSTPQQNSWTSDWVEFYGEHRLGYQLKLAQQQYRDNDIYEKGQRLLHNLPALFRDIEIKPCLLHGDLWSGNVFSDRDNEPVILDPACYYGHNEAEFGMSWCASFGPMFYNSYFEVMPKQPGFEERKNLYMLYHYLNHYNMFGSGYRSSCTSILDGYLRMLNS